MDISHTYIYIYMDISCIYIYIWICHIYTDVQVCICIWISTYTHRGKYDVSMILKTPKKLNSGITKGLYKEKCRVVITMP